MGLFFYLIIRFVQNILRYEESRFIVMGSFIR